MCGKKISIGLFVSLCFVAQGFAVELKTNVQKESYSIGASTGAYISNQLFEQNEFGIKADIDALIDGFVDALKKKQKLSDEEIITHLNNRAEGLNKISQERFSQQLNANLDAGKKYLANNAKNKKVITTKSGLQYEKIAEGKGVKPKPESIVLIHYKGSLLDGTLFDNTYERKQPAHLSMINVIDGLQEGLMLMSEGEKAKIVIPSELAYGNADVQAIPAGSTVIFEVELIKVLKPGELNNSAKALSEETKKEMSETKQPLKKL
ncbi:FKBP-type peptidyl-prolyl cis-trans isomerase [Sulfurospirillum barnesii]|uniref:Peptidyl-prolyl cis-trans isomerase n=1 Tax=Sulfurospirillum barnesii (strain ATCC 700032 / DSM 10660 / SES-3) TaxID=760154 RepID=I3XVU9_SULBS|nr:FKBP-type peptidyl-prolyl cis-trans isomerase [Sulfurospirillum barnesii]AFL68073.1 FKBP-type peptidyl-prolyl cis-trans isomerase [Sulfurospirillum barnesii SES-3]